MDIELNPVEEIHTEADKEEEVENEDHIIDFREETRRTDFVIIVEGTRLYVAKNILSLASPVFDRMFQSDFKECEKGVIEMPGKKLEDVKLFLQCIYPNTLTPITFETAMKILPLIEEYQVFQLKMTCEKAISDVVNEDTPTVMLYQILSTACTYGLVYVREKCVGLMTNKSTKESELAKKNHSIPDAVMNEILALKIADLESSNKHLKAYKEEKMEIMSSNIDVFKEYVAKDLLDTKHVSLDSTCKWKSNEVLMKLNSKSLNAGCKVVVLDVKLAITTEGLKRSSILTILHLCVVAEDLKDSFKPFDIKVKIIPLNRGANQNNLSFVFGGKIRPDNCQVVENIENISSIINEHNGFIQNGKIWMLIQIFMSEPITQ